MTKIRANIYTLEKSLLLEFTFLDAKILNESFHIEKDNFFFKKDDNAEEDYQKEFSISVLDFSSSENKFLIENFNNAITYHVCFPSKDNWKIPTFFSFNSNEERNNFKAIIIKCLTKFCHLEYFDKECSKIISDRYETYEFK